MDRRDAGWGSSIQGKKPFPSSVTSWPALKTTSSYTHIGLRVPDEEVPIMSPLVEDVITLGTGDGAVVPVPCGEVTRVLGHITHWHGRGRWGGGSSIDVHPLHPLLREVVGELQ